jgi:hypothetical protein
MTHLARYGSDDGRTCDLADGWEPAGEEVLATARNQTHTTLTRAECVEGLAQYCDRDSSFAGTLFLDVEPTDPFVIEPSDST